jgi:hypothetical protein
MPLWLLAGILLAAHSATAPPIRPPQVEYGTYVGGHAKDGTTSLAVDSSGNVWVAGTTPSPDFPTTPGAFKTQTTVNDNDWVGFVTKLSPAGDRFVYSTLLGGSWRSTANGVAVDSDGNAVKLANGPMAWYRSIGGSDETKLSGITAGLPGSVFVCGSSYSPDFPVTAGAIATHPARGSDMVLLRLSAFDGRVLYATFLGGTQHLKQRQ